MAKLKSCRICTPTCIRTCPIVKQRAQFKKRISCPNCGARFQIDDSSCPQCGTQIESVCPDCLTANSLTEDGCSACGFSYQFVDAGPSQWYRYDLEDMVDRFAPPPGESQSS